MTGFGEANCDANGLPVPAARVTGPFCGDDDRTESVGDDASDVDSSSASSVVPSEFDADAAGLVFEVCGRLGLVVCFPALGGVN